MRRAEETKKEWTANPDQFQRFLVWLDAGAADSGGESYLKMLRRLAAYFDRKNCLAPDELADETLSRVARRLAEEAGEITTETPAKYCYITARFVFLEHLRGIEKRSVSIDEVKADRIAEKQTDDEAATKEKMLACLEKCVGELDETNRDLIVRYYYGAERVKIENRRRLAGDLGISPNALTIRACRIREKLEICVRRCAKQNG